jgi:hypothetical protein
MSAKYTWYVEPSDAHTNEVIATQLPSESAITGVYCQDGQKRDFWVCTHAFITKLHNSQETAQLEFKVFNRKGKYGPVNQWKFTRRRRPLTLSAALSKGLVKMGSAVPPPRHTR